MVQKSGGVTNRPGTDYIQAIKTSSAEGTRLLKFIFNNEETYLLEFGEKYIRFFKQGIPVMPVGDEWTITTEYHVGDVVINQDDLYWYCIGDHTSSALDEPGHGGGSPTVWAFMPTFVYEIPTPYLLSELEELQYVQSGNTISLVHPDHPPMDLIRDGIKWIIQKTTFGPQLPAPTGLDVGGAGGTAGDVFYAVTAVMEDTLEESKPAIFQHDNIPDETHPNALVWDSVPGAISYNVYRSYDGVTYGLINAAGGLPSTLTDATWVDSVSTATSVDNVNWTQAPDFLHNVLTMNIATRAYDNTYDYKLQGTLTPTPGASGISKGRFFITVQPTGGIFGVGGQLPVVAGISQEFTTVDGFTNGPFLIEGSFTLPIEFSALYTGLIVRFFPQAMGATVTGMVDFKLEAVAPNNEISWLTQVMTYGDYGQEQDNAVAPPQDPGFFRAHDDFPSVTGFYQQRRFYASTRNEPLKVWGSQIGRFNNFSKSTPLLDTDAVSFTMVGPQANSPRHMIDLGKLLILTMGGEMRIDGDDAGIIRPDAINPNSMGENGIAENLRPLKVVDSMVYVQSRGNIVRTMRPVKDGGFEGTELSIFASHLFEGKTIVDWDYAKTPNSIVWVVFSDGTMAGLTYQPEHSIWAWHRHDTDGLVERVVCLPEGDEDRVYMIVRREIDGQTLRYIERMASRYFQDIEDAHFLDCATRFDGMNTTATTVTIGAMVGPESEDGWGNEDELNIQFSSAYATADMVGQCIFVMDNDGDWLKLKVTAYNSNVQLKGIPDRTVPMELREEATAVWALAVNTVADLEHLEGRGVAILGDGYVVANPNRLEMEEVVVEDGAVAWNPDEYYVNVLVGLPFVSDLQTLDLDTPSGPSRKEDMSLVSSVGLYVKDSRGFFAGLPNHVSEDDLVEGLQEYLGRDDEEWGEINDLVTDFLQVGIESEWNTNGRVFIRNIDPLPLNILSITPMGYI